MAEIDPKLFAPGTETSRKLLQLARECIQLGNEFVTARKAKWDKTDKTMLAYVDTNETYTDTDDGNKEKRKLPFARSIVIPYTYAAVQVILSHLMAVFTQNYPLFPLKGRTSKDAEGARYMEAALAYQAEMKEFVVALYAWFLDALKYGVGVMKNTWEVEGSVVPFRRMTPVSLFGQTLGHTVEEGKEWRERYQGNVPTVIDPYSYYPDTRVPIHRVQDGEFTGQFLAVNLTYLKRKEAQGTYHHIDSIAERTVDFYSKNKPIRTDIMGSSDSGSGGLLSSKKRGMIGLDEIIVEIIPNDYGLGTSKESEKFILTVANEIVLVRCEPLDYPSGEFPYQIIVPNLDYHNLTNPGIPEVISGLQEMTDWLFNSHIDNVRKSLNDMLVFDPSMIEVEDLLSPQGGRLIRVAEDFYGVPGAVREGVQQLQVADVTRGHLGDSQWLIALIQTVLGTGDPLMGNYANSARSATETATVASLGTGRQKTLAELFAAMGIRPWVRQMIANTRHFLTGEQWVAITDTKGAEQWANFNPSDLQGEYDCVIMDGSLPIDRAAMANAWANLIGVVAKSQFLSQQYDTTPMFEQFARSLGVKDISDFRRQGPVNVSVQPDEAVAAGAQSGQLEPAPPDLFLPGMQSRGSAFGA